MDPYLEGELWQEFHDRLASQISVQLLPLLRPKYVALLAKRYVLDRAALSVLDLQLEQRVMCPDVHVVQMHEAGTASQPTGITTPTAELTSLMDEEIPILSVEIRDVAERRLVTVVEILSPVNKRGEGSRDYIERRNPLLHTRTHVLEIDLLRHGSRIPLQGPLPVAPYYVFLSRFTRRPRTEVWAIPLRQRLPVVPVPLLPPDEDVPLDLQAATDACFALVGYERLLNYYEPPPPPAFSEADTAWITERLQTRNWGTE
jgi:hypothetical protein